MNTNTKTLALHESFDGRILKWSGFALCAFLVGAFLSTNDAGATAAREQAASNAAHATTTCSDVARCG